MSGLRPPLSGGARADRPRSARRSPGSGPSMGSERNSPHGGISRIPDDLETLAYRVVQEALSNAAKHSQAAHVTVRSNSTRCSSASRSSTTGSASTTHVRGSSCRWAAWASPPCASAWSSRAARSSFGRRRSAARRSSRPSRWTSPRRARAGVNDADRRPRRTGGRHLLAGRARRTRAGRTVGPVGPVPVGPVGPVGSGGGARARRRAGARGRQVHRSRRPTIV